mmetsp:Transcript_37843/g.82947  ORF Transcript_37843/g.82947 Transcript_37843/m.82947 type:complete len:298 (+) Transcript_37843:113-1006(+)
MSSSPDNAPILLSSASPKDIRSSAPRYVITCCFVDARASGSSDDRPPMIVSFSFSGTTGSLLGTTSASASFLSSSMMSSIVPSQPASPIGSEPAAARSAIPPPTPSLSSCIFSHPSLEDCGDKRFDPWLCSVSALAANRRITVSCPSRTCFITSSCLSTTRPIISACSTINILCLVIISFCSSTIPVNASILRSNFDIRTELAASRRCDVSIMRRLIDSSVDDTIMRRADIAAPMSTWVGIECCDDDGGGDDEAAPVVTGAWGVDWEAGGAATPPPDIIAMSAAMEGGCPCPVPGGI